jgi:hypothetical protein
MQISHTVMVDKQQKKFNLNYNTITFLSALRNGERSENDFDAAKMHYFSNFG